MDEHNPTEPSSPAGDGERKKPARTRTAPTWLPRALFESALIVFSVFLALVLNEWRAELNQRDQVAQALSAIRAEIEENERLVSLSLEYHERLAEAFGAAAQAEAETPDLSVVTYGLLFPARVLRTAWESGDSVDLAAGIEYQTLLELSSLYARQDEYASLSRAMGEALYWPATTNSSGCDFHFCRSRSLIIGLPLARSAAEGGRSDFNFFQREVTA